MLNLISRFACIWPREVSDFFNSEAPMQSEQDRQLKREALVYQDRKDGSDGNFRQRVLSKHWELWKPLSGNINESPWVSYIHQYPWMPMLIEVEDVASAASACDVQLKSFQVSRPSTPKAPSEEVRMCKLRPRDGWLLSLFSKKTQSCEGVVKLFLSKTLRKKTWCPCGTCGMSDLQGLVLSRPLSATSRPLSATSRTAELRTLGAELEKCSEVKFSYAKLKLKNWI